MKRTLLYLLALIVLAGLGFAYLQYNKGHRDTASETAAYSLQASGLFQEYETDEAAANQKYLDKLILVAGKVSGVTTADDSTTTLSLQTDDPLFVVSCQLLPREKEKLAGITAGQEIKVKGICTGKLMDVVLVRSVIAE